MAGQIYFTIVSIMAADDLATPGARGIRKHDIDLVCMEYSLPA